MSRYNPSNWYWLADDSRLFSSKSQSLIQSSDPDYQAWVASGGFATPWPRDDAGAQTTASLQEVLMPYNLFIDLKAYAAFVRYNKEVGGTTISGVAYPTDRETQAKMTSAFALGQVNPSATFQWKLSDGTFATLTVAQLTTVATVVGAFVQACFATEATVVAGINGGTIATRDQVDAAFAG